MSKILNYFDRAYLVNLKERPDRRKFALDQLEHVGIHDVSVIEAAKPEHKYPFKTIHAHGCCLSHLKVYEQSKLDGAENFLIFEDDVVFCDDFLEKIKPVLENLRLVDWDIFYFFKPRKGFNDLSGTRGQIIEKFDTGLVQTSGTILTHAYAVNRQCLDELSKKLKPSYLEKYVPIDIRPIDKAISNMRLKLFACSTDLTHQNLDLLVQKN